MAAFFFHSVGKCTEAVGIVCVLYNGDKCDPRAAPNIQIPTWERPDIQ